MEKSPKQLLREKIKQKRNNRKSKGNDPIDSIPKDPMDFAAMINQVQSILQTNPDMVKKVNSCMKNILSNGELMKSISSQIGNQTLSNNVSESSEEATSNDSKQ